MENFVFCAAQNKTKFLPRSIFSYFLLHKCQVYYILRKVETLTVGSNYSQFDILLSTLLVPTMKIVYIEQMHQQYQLVQVLEWQPAHLKFLVLNRIIYFPYQPIMKTGRQLFSVRCDFLLLRYFLSVYIIVLGFWDILKNNDFNLFLANPLILYPL